MEKLGIIGCGNMGGAIAQSVQTEVVLFDNDLAKAAALADTASHITSSGSMEELFSQCDTIMIAVKPQILASLYPTFKKLGSAKKHWISIAAGVPLSVLSKNLGTDEVVRFMPNIAAQQKQAVTAVAKQAGCSDSHLSFALEVAKSFGSAFELPESQFSAFIGISGSGIAYVFAFVHALAMGGVVEGIPYPQAAQIATDTLNSATSLLKASGANPIDLATKVCSAGGTTIDGMQSLAEGAFEAVVMQAVEAAAEKSKALEAKAANADNQ